MGIYSKMSNAWEVTKGAAFLATAALPFGYAWIHWKFPTLWEDIKLTRQRLGLFKTMTDHDKSRTSIIDYFEAHARTRPSHPCILYENEMYTYGEVARNTNRVARWVSTAHPSLEQGDTVCVLLHNGPTFLWTWLGLLKLGVISSLMNYNLKGSSLLHCIRSSDCKCLLFGSEFLDVVCNILPEITELNITVWMINDTGIVGLSPPPDVVTVDLSSVSDESCPNVPISGIGDVASYIFTSGTTGMPKPAVIPHSKLLLPAIAYHFHTNLSSDDVYYISMPLYHSAALLISVCGSFYKGATVAIARKFSASRFWDDVRKHRVTIFQYIGEICRYLLSQPKKENDGQYPRPLRAAVGNGLRIEIWKEFQNRFNIGQIFEFYGATEGVMGFINVDGHLGSVGKFPWTLKKLMDVVEIVDYDDTSGEPRRDIHGRCIPLPTGKPGLMLIKITERKKFAGYKGRPEMNEGKIVRNVKVIGDMYFNTGDVLKIDSSGYIYFIDRIGDTFRWKAENVSTFEVLHVLASYPPIMDANVYGVHVPGHEGRAGMAAIVLHKGAVVEWSHLYRHVTSSLPSYAQPKFLRLVTETELTGTFKQKKTELVKRGFTEDWEEVYIIDPSQETYLPITTNHIKELATGRSKL